MRTSKIAALIPLSILIGSGECSARRWSILIDGTGDLLSDAAAQGNALVLVFSARAFHAAFGWCEIFGQVQGHRIFMIFRIGFSPIKSHSKMCAACTASQTRVRTHIMHSV